MEAAAEDYENVAGGVSAGLYGNLSNWQPSTGMDQIYSNVWSKKEQMKDTACLV